MPSDPPQRPGEHLRIDWLPRLFPGDEIALRRLATALDVGVNQLHDFTRGKTNVTPLLALRLGRVIEGTTPEYWMDRQRDYDLWKCRRALGDKLEGLKVVRAAGAKRGSRG